MTDSTYPTEETGSYDAVLGRFLRDMDRVQDRADVASLLARAVAVDPDRAEEFRALAAGYQRLRGLREPERLGPYRVRRLLAVGGMGKLYEAEEEGLPRVVAVKTIKLGTAADSHSLARFDRERRTLARLHHTNIVPIYATGQQDGLLYFSMPRLQGPSLRAFIKTASSISSVPSSPSSAPTFDQLISAASAEEEKDHLSRGFGAGEPDRPAETETKAVANGHRASPHLPPDYCRRVAAMMAEVAEAVHHAHQAGVIHRDLKPANILVESRGHPWVLDFGLAHLKGEPPPPPPGGSDGEVDPGGPTVGIGTPLYMAPEQLHRPKRKGDTAPTLPIARVNSRRSA